MTDYLKEVWLRCQCGVEPWIGTRGDSCISCGSIADWQGGEEVEGVYVWASDWGGYDERIKGIFKTKAEAEIARGPKGYGETFFQPFGEV